MTGRQENNYYTPKCREQ